MCSEAMVRQMSFRVQLIQNPGIPAGYADVTGW